jgi:hypothetical protein
MYSRVKIVTLGNLTLRPCLTGMTAASSRVGAMDERERLLSKLERYLTIRDRISDGLAVAVIEELIRETGESLTQIENNVPDQKVVQPSSEEVPQ